MERPGEATQLLQRLGAGDEAAAGELLPLVYAELRVLAERFLAGERVGHTLQPTALVHEAWLKLADQTAIAWDGRRHFLRVAARAMRQVLVDHARARRARKRGGERLRVELDEALASYEDRAIDLLALDEVLERLGAKDRRLGVLVELRFFVGLTMEECGRELGLSVDQAAHAWEFARRWLYRELRPPRRARRAISDARWSELRAIVEQAFALAESEREDFLVSRCGPDAELLAEARALISPAAPPSGFLAPPAPILGLASGAQVGAYRLRRVLASGGMGTVWEAEQESPSRLVALKVMSQALASPDSRRRFAYEAQIQGLLKHPGIAQIFASGLFRPHVGAPEIPWFAMELVEGARTIAEHCRERGLSLRARLQLFREACEAVQHGHQRGVIHRDLKPGNLLVDAQGRVKVIDFGVARATGTEHPEASVHTSPGEILGTLRYMSPEQLGTHPGDVDTRSDVYALGVVLYELLWGEPPFAIAGTPLTEVARIIRDEAPPPPSTRTRGLPAELDWMVLKALEKERERRYASAGELAADLGRYLADEPVLASPPSAAYRERKFVARHRAGVAAGPMALVALLAGSAAALSGMVQARAQRDRAQLEQDAEDEAREAEAREREAAVRAQQRVEGEAEKARVVSAFLTEILTSPDPDREGHDVRVADLLERAATDIPVKFAERPEVRAELTQAVGRSLHALGLYDLSEPLVREALELCRAAFGENDARTRGVLGGLAVQLANQRRFDEAEPLLREVREKAIALDGRDSPAAFKAGNDLALVLAVQRRVDEAAPLAEELLEIARRVRGEDSAEHGNALHLLGLVRKGQDRLEEAVDLQRRALEILTGARRESDTDVLDALNSLALALEGLERHAEAGEILRDRLARTERVLGPAHPGTLAVMYKLAYSLECQGRSEEAVDMHRRCLEARRDHLGPANSSTWRSEDGLARALLAARRIEEAETELTGAADRRRARGEAGAAALRESLKLLVELYQAAGRAAEAELLRAELGKK